MTTATGIISWQAQASAFGDAKIDMQIASTRLAAINNHRFPGQYYDAETGLHYNYYRYYDPSTGRYITSDPIGLDGGLNTYGYVGGNPLYWSDPYGLTESGAGIGAAIGCGIGGFIGSTAGGAAGCGIGGAIGAVIGDVVSDMCSDNDDDRCRKIKNQCIQGCSDFVLQKPRGRRGDLGGMDFHWCVRQYLDRNGC
jgi:RHS repeat-associated protein